MDAQSTPINLEARPSFKRSLKRIKEQVPVERYASELTELHPAGKSLRGRCPIHKGDNSHAFTVYPEDNRWFCFRCNIGGDVLDLCEMAEKHADVWTALVSLAQRFDIELSRRPPQWFGWQDTKTKRRNEIQQIRAKLYQRRMFRLYFADYIAAIEDETEREEEAERVWAGATCHPRVCFHHLPTRSC